MRFAVQRELEGVLVLSSDVDVFNAAGKRVGNDHPTPQATQGQLDAFTAWLNTNLAAYEAATGLIELEED